MNLFKRIQLSKQVKIDNADISKCFQRVFANADGEKILDYLTKLTLEKVMPESASGNELRHLEGQRYIVKFILNKAL